MKIQVREPGSSDFELMERLILAEGPNEWNYITQESIDSQFELIRAGQACAVLLEDTEILGFAVLMFGTACPSKLEKYCVLAEIAYIGDVVVSSLHSGKGYGSALLEASIAEAESRGVATVYIERHEENLASAGMMKKAGFSLVECFHDPEKRSAGTRNTVVMARSS